MQHCAHTGNTEVQLHVSVAVPSQCANALAWLYTEGVQRIGDLLGAAPDIGIGAAVDRTFDRA
ncbi:hypothetical protein D3C80_1860190 [compost metagenome]